MTPAHVTGNGGRAPLKEDDEGGDGGMGLGRTLALSDGIFAIAMTLVAFQIQPPVLKSNQVHDLAHKLGGLGDGYFVYLLTFPVIGLLWLAHHRLFRTLERADEPLMVLNLLFLMTVAALPFPSAVLGRYGSQPVAVVLYASSVATAGLLLSALSVVAYRRRLMSPAGSTDRFREALWRSGSMAGVFILSIPLAIISPTVAPYVWLALLPIRFVNPTRRSRSGPAGGRRGGAAAAD
jgi:uncharacterized membrane protein